MLGLVLADDLMLLYVFWELTTVLSYLLVGHYVERKSARRAAMQALVVTTLGGLAMLIGMIMLGEQAGTYRISAIVESAPRGCVHRRRRRADPGRRDHQVPRSSRSTSGCRGPWRRRRR